jgi:electron-transferring-flavoprotein dehydrogenase
VIEIENGWRDSDIGQDLKRVRNVKPLWSKLGTAAGVALGGSTCGPTRCSASRPSAR